MEPCEFVSFRKKLKKTQAQMAQLLGVSLKAIHSYEQGWRSIPAYIERQILFLVIRKHANEALKIPCWNIKECPEELKEQCPAWEFNAGDLCWFLNGTICNGVVHKTWHDKIKICIKCEAMPSLLDI